METISPPLDGEAIDYIAKHKEFLENNHFFTFDVGDEDEMKLLEHDLSIKELLYIAWCRHIFRDVVLINKSKILGIGGTHRSGKSLWACTMAYIWDSTFLPRMDKRVVQTPKAFMDEIKYIKDNNIHGAVFVIDEGGVVAPSDAFYEEWYKTLNRTIQVIGYLNPIIIFCAVIRDNIGAKFRKLYNIQSKARRYNLQYSKIKIFDLNYDDLRGRTTPKRPHIRIFGKKYILDGVKFGRPPKFIESAYRKLTEPSKDKLVDSYTKTIGEAETRGPVKGKREQLRQEQAKIVDSIYLKVVADYSKYQTPRSRTGRVVLDALRIQSDHEALSYRGAEIVKKKAEDVLNEKA